MQRYNFEKVKAGAMVGNIFIGKINVDNCILSDKCELTILPDGTIKLVQFAAEFPEMKSFADYNKLADLLNNWLTVKKEGLVEATIAGTKYTGTEIIIDGQQVFVDGLLATKDAANKFARDGKYHSKGSKWEGGLFTSLKNVEYQNTSSNFRVKNIFIHYAENGRGSSVSMAIEFKDKDTYDKFSSLCPTQLQKYAQLINAKFCIIKFHADGSDYRFAVRKMLSDILQGIHQVDPLDKKSFDTMVSFYNLNLSENELKQANDKELLAGVDETNPDNADIELRKPSLT